MRLKINRGFSYEESDTHLFVLKILTLALGTCAVHSSMDAQLGSSRIDMKGLMMVYKESIRKRMR